MICPKCKSDKVIVQAVSNTRSKGKGCLYWFFIGLWLEIFLWICFTIPMIFGKLFGSKKIRTRIEQRAVCQDCGHMWKV